MPDDAGSDGEQNLDGDGAGQASVAGWDVPGYTGLKTQSISFTAPASGMPGGSAHLSATGGGSGNPVVFSVASSSGPGVCTVSGSTVTFGAVGSCVIDANQAGNAQYMAAPQVQRTITVTKPAQRCSPGGGKGKGGCKGKGGGGSG